MKELIEDEEKIILCLLRMRLSIYMALKHTQNAN